MGAEIHFLANLVGKIKNAYFVPRHVEKRHLNMSFNVFVLHYKLQGKFKTDHSKNCKYFSIVDNISLPDRTLCVRPKNKMFRFNFPRLILK